MMGMDTTLTGEMLLERMVQAVEAVRDRLRRVTAALDQAKTDYAVVGGNAVAVWVARVDRAAVRNTQDVDILIRRSDLESVKSILEKAGFFYRHSSGLDMFLDGPEGRARDAVHVIFAGEKVRPEYVEPAPDVIPFEIAPPFHTLPLDALVRMKLTSFRDKDRTHIRDLIGVELIDATWLNRLPPVLAERLQTILATPEG
jgi:hypothetical protein